MASLIDFRQSGAVPGSRRRPTPPMSDRDDAPGRHAGWWILPAVVLGAAGWVLALRMLLGVLA